MNLRHRLAALTCAGVVVATTLATGSTSAIGAGAPISLKGKPGIAALVDLDVILGKGIATFGSVPTADRVADLRALGLAVQPMEKLPLALVSGNVSAMKQAVKTGLARDVYPDEQLSYEDTPSSDVTSSSPAAAEALRASGFTGKGVTVGVIDSGCDATHPDLAKRVKHNVVLLSGEYANVYNHATTIVLPVDQGPYSNTDIGSGHGTHVAGIIAADGSTGPQHLGVAPEAELACFGIGAVLTTTAVVTAFDHILAHPEMGVDVVNNSWGNAFRQFDPQDPVNVATKAVSDKGITVVFSAGNSGDGNAEASVSPFNQAPWVISVAASDLQRQRGAFSSNGIVHDNTEAVALGTGGHTGEVSHTVAIGDRMGLIHPDISAPGVAISSTCSSTGTLIGPCLTPANDTASGTSMSGPHVAGAAAVLEQARPELSPLQVQKALLATATPMYAGGKEVPFWQVGFGHVNLDKAVALVRSADWKDAVSSAYSAAVSRELSTDGWKVLRSDLWQYDAVPGSVQGSDTRTFEVSVGKQTRRLYVLVEVPDHFVPGLYTATLTDPNGKVLGTTEKSLTVPTTVPGTYQVRIVGDLALADPDTIDSDSVNGRVIFVDVAQLKATD